MRKHLKLNLLYFLIFIGTICGCGSDMNTPSNDTGSAAFSLKWENPQNPDNTSLRNLSLPKGEAISELSYAPIDCTALGVSTVSANVYDSGGTLITGGGPWNCSAHSGTITGISAGINRMITVSGKDSSNKIIYNGQITGVTINKDQTTDAGQITMSYVANDTTAPTDGTLSASAGNQQVSLNWSGFTDSNSGLGSYKLVYSTTSTPSCSTGTQIFTGTGTSYTHTGLNNGGTYYYRVCATDNAGNTSSGAIASSIPQSTTTTTTTGTTTTTTTGTTTTSGSFPYGGDGKDGDVVISTSSSLSKDMYYNNLTVNNGVTLTTAGYRIFVKDTLTNNGTISWVGNTGGNGGNGGNGSNGSGGSGGTAGAGASAMTSGNLPGGEAGTNGSSGGGGGGAPYGQGSGYSGGSGTNGISGTSRNNTLMQNTAANGTSNTTSSGGSGGGFIYWTGGTGGTGGNSGSGGTSTITSDLRIPPFIITFQDSSGTTFNVSGSSGGSGGGGGGGGGASGSGGYGGGGGGGGSSGGSGSNGGVIIVSAKTLTNNGTISATGGAGGTGGNGGNGGNGGFDMGGGGGGSGGAGGAGGNGGIVIIIYQTLTNNGTISASGGAGGTGGNGGNYGVPGGGNSAGQGDGGFNGANGNTGNAGTVIQTGY